MASSCWIAWNLKTLAEIQIGVSHTPSSSNRGQQPVPIPEYNHRYLIQANANITPDSGSQVDLCFKVQLDTDQKGSALLVALVIGRTPQELACKW